MRGAGSAYRYTPNSSQPSSNAALLDEVRDGAEQLTQMEQRHPLPPPRLQCPDLTVSVEEAGRCVSSAVHRTQVSFRPHPAHHQVHENKLTSRGTTLSRRSYLHTQALDVGPLCQQLGQLVGGVQVAAFGAGLE